MQYIDEYECDPETCSDEEHQELESHQQKAKKGMCCKQKKGQSGKENYFKTLFSFDKMQETLNTVSRLEKQVGQADVINAVVVENRELREQVQI